MKILVYTGYDNNKKYKEMGDFSSMNKLAYAQKHGYSFLCDRSYADYGRPISWFKIQRMIQLIDKYDWIFWTDADSIITNPEISLESIIDCPGKPTTTLRIKEENVEVSLDNSQKASFICSDDELGPCMANFLVKFTATNLELLNKIYSSIEFENHPWWDQGAAHNIWYNRPYLRKELKVLPKSKLHRGFHDYQNGDFIIHDKFHIENGQIIPK